MSILRFSSVRFKCYLKFPRFILIVSSYYFINRQNSLKKKEKSNNHNLIIYFQNSPKIKKHLSQYILVKYRNRFPNRIQPNLREKNPSRSSMNQVYQVSTRKW